MPSLVCVMNTWRLTTFSSVLIWAHNTKFVWSYWSLSYSLISTILFLKFRFWFRYGIKFFSFWNSMILSSQTFEGMRIKLNWVILVKSKQDYVMGLSRATVDCNAVIISVAHIEVNLFLYLSFSLFLFFPLSFSLFFFLAISKAILLKNWSKGVNGTVVHGEAPIKVLSYNEYKIYLRLWKTGIIWEWKVG